MFEDRTHGWEPPHCRKSKGLPMASELSILSCMSQEPKRTNQLLGVWMGLGISVGVALGIVLDNVGLGIALGVAIGAALGSVHSARTQSKSEEPTYFVVLGSWFVVALGIAVVVFIVVD